MGGDRCLQLMAGVHLFMCSPWKGKIESLRHDGVFHPPYILHLFLRLGIKQINPSLPCQRLSCGSKPPQFLYSRGFGVKHFQGIFFGAFKCHIGSLQFLENFSCVILFNQWRWRVHCCCQRMIRKTCVCTRLTSVWWWWWGDRGSGTGPHQQHHQQIPSNLYVVITNQRHQLINQLVASSIWIESTLVHLFLSRNMHVPCSICWWWSGSIEQFVRKLSDPSLIRMTRIEIWSLRDKIFSDDLWLICSLITHD
jgi:hypothetical protein